MLRIALAQIDVTVGDFKGNRARILRVFREAGRLQADIVVFPELALCGYPPEDLLFKEGFVADGLKVLHTLTRQIKGPTAIIGFVDKDRGGRLYNAAAVIAEGRIKGVYHKHRLPNYGVFDEKRYFQEGRQNFLYSAGPHLVGLNICEDIWDDDGVHAVQARAGSKILINISASPYDFGKLEQRKQLLIRRARKTRNFICYVNLVGGQDELVFDGGSLIVDPDGNIAASGKQFEEDLVVADLPVPGGPSSLKARRGLKIIRQPLKQTRRKPFPPHLCPLLPPKERILKALVLGTRDYVRKNGFEKVVVGLSGGIDSSLVAAIAVQAVGRENVIGISMPSPYSSAGTQGDARRLAGNLGIRFIEVPIQNIFRAYGEAMAGEFAGRAFDITEENIQARIRGNILMAFSNKFGWLVLTTGNKSEIAVGYCTLYGDMSGGFAVIKDVPKTKVYELAALINQKCGGVIPESIISRPPTAELREGQKDQDTLPAYETLDSLIRAYVEEHRSIKTIERMANDPRMVKQIIRMIDRSEYKRRQAPPGIKITPRAFGKDWRLPITNRYNCH